jgi:sigma-B regulation protein RsbU (phosphoserine phosphatase)
VQILAEEPPDDLCAMVSRLDKAIAVNSPINRFITLFFAILEPDTNEMIYCNAGHNPPLIVHADGSFERTEVLGSVLGMLPELGYEQRRCAFVPGDLLVVFSVGVTEAESPEEEEYGDERLAKWLGSQLTRPAADLVTGILEEVDRFTDGAPAFDDVTLVVARYPEKT